MHDIRNFAYICPLVDDVSAHRIGIINSIDKEIARMEKREIKPLAFCFNGVRSEVDLQKDDGLEYLVKMEPLFGCVDNDGRCDSHVARQFYHALNNNEIFRKKSLELAQEFIEDDALLATLDAFGLDYRKFWYLCLALKWRTCNEFCFGVWNPMRVEVLLELEKKLQTFAPLLLPDIGAKCSQHDFYAALRTKASLELRIDTENHPFRIKDNGTLALIWYAIDSLLDSAENGEKPWLDRFLRYAAGRRDKEETNPELVISFYSKLDCFLKDLKGKRGVRYMSGNKEKIASASKYFLISRMIYRTGLIRGKDGKKFLDEDNKNPFLKGYLKDHRKNSRKE